MKDNNHILTLQETEELCQMYLDCRLSVLEERELQYLLQKIPFDSAIINEARLIMGIEETIAEKASKTTNISTKSPLYKIWRYIGVAASIVLLLVIGITFFSNTPESSPGESYHIAYANGHQLSGDAARRQIENAIKAADDFMAAMEEQETRDKEMYDKFINHNPFEE